MKILIVRTFPDILNIDTYNVQEIGLAKALIRKGHECDIVLFGGKNHSEWKEYSFTENEKEYKYRIFWCHGFNLLKMGIMPDVMKIIPNYDVIQVHEYEQLLSWKLYRKQIKPTIVYHGLYASNYTKGYNLKCAVFDKLFFKWHKYDNVICATKSEPAAKLLLTKGFKKVTSVGVGLDDSRFSEAETTKKTDSDSYLLLYIGKIEDRRNSLFMIDVFEELLRRGLDVKLKVIGTGDKEYLNRFMDRTSQLRNDEKLIYLPRIEQSETPAEYVNADAFIFPSQYEIFGMVLLEAMYFGCPVISSFNGGSGTLITNDELGVLQSGFDASSWADAIEKLLKDPEKRAKISSNSKALIRNEYLWDAIADKFISLYEEALRN